MYHITFELTMQCWILQIECLHFSQYSILFSQTEYGRQIGGAMIQEEKLKKVCDDFTLLNAEQQDYILGILQALAFANSTNKQAEFESSETKPQK